MILKRTCTLIGTVTKGRGEKQVVIIPTQSATIITHTLLTNHKKITHYWPCTEKAFTVRSLPLSPNSLLTPYHEVCISRSSAHKSKQININGKKHN